MKNYIEDVLIIAGLTVIVYATFLWSVVGGLYCLGAALLGVGIFLAKFPLSGGKKK